MSIRQVFRVQCDGPGKEWLSYTEDYVPGTDIESRHEVAAPTAERAFNWPTEHAARVAALKAGWVTKLGAPGVPGVQWWCPVCAVSTYLTGEAAVCICTHPKSDHNLNDLCIAVPGVLGCGCLGFAEKWIGS